MKVIQSLYKDPTHTKFKEPFELKDSNEIVYGPDFAKIGEFIINISCVLFKLKLLDYSDEFKIGICVPKGLDTKFHPNDQETTLSSLLYLLNQMKVYNPIHYVFFEYDNFQDQYTETFKPLRAPIHIWQTEQRWIGDGDYICVKESRNKGWMPPADMSNITDQAADLGLDIKVIKYGMKMSEQMNLLSHCKCLVTERGGQILIAALLGTPFILCSAENELLMDRTQRLGRTHPNHGELGTQIFQSDALGMNPDTKTLVNDRVVNQRFANFLLTVDYCDNSNVLRDFIECDSIPNLQKEYVKRNFVMCENLTEQYLQHIRVLADV